MRSIPFYANRRGLDLEIFSSRQEYSLQFPRIIIYRKVVSLQQVTTWVRKLRVVWSRESSRGPNESDYPFNGRITATYSLKVIEPPLSQQCTWVRTTSCVVESRVSIRSQAKFDDPELVV